MSSLKVMTFCCWWGGFFFWGWGCGCFGFLVGFFFTGHCINLTDELAFSKGNSCFALLFLTFPFDQEWKWGKRSRGRNSMRCSFSKQYETQMRVWVLVVWMFCFGVFYPSLRLMHYCMADRNLEIFLGPLGTENIYRS